MQYEVMIERISPLSMNRLPHVPMCVQEGWEPFFVSRDAGDTLLWLCRRTDLAQTEVFEDIPDRLKQISRRVKKISEHKCK